MCVCLPLAWWFGIGSSVSNVLSSLVVLFYLFVIAIFPAKAHLISYKLSGVNAPIFVDVRAPECRYASKLNHPAVCTYLKVESDVLLSWVNSFRMIGRDALCDNNEFQYDVSVLAERRHGLTLPMRMLAFILSFVSGAGMLCFFDNRIVTTSKVSVACALSYETIRQRFGVVDREKIFRFVAQAIPGANWDATRQNTQFVDTVNFIYDLMVYDTIKLGGNWSHHFPLSPDLPWVRSVPMGGLTSPHGVRKI